MPAFNTCRHVASSIKCCLFYKSTADPVLKKTEREKNSMVHFVRCHRSFLIFIEYWTKLKFSAPIIYSRCIKAISAIYLSYNRPVFSTRTTYRVSTFDLTYFVLLKVYKKAYKCTSVLCFLVDSKENICKLQLLRRRRKIFHKLSKRHKRITNKNTQTQICLNGILRNISLNLLVNHIYVKSSYNVDKIYCLISDGAFYIFLS